MGNLGFLIRCFELWYFLRKIEIDRSCSQSSFYSPVVSFLLNIKCLYTNDNEFAFGNIFGFLFANKILLPKSLYSWSKKRLILGKVLYYEGVKEGVYLHNWVYQHNESLRSRKPKFILGLNLGMLNIIQINLNFVLVSSNRF